MNRITMTLVSLVAITLSVTAFASDRAKEAPERLRPNKAFVPRTGKLGPAKDPLDKLSDPLFARSSSKSQADLGRNGSGGGTGMGRRIEGHSGS
jgi:hypothetical protein